MEAAPHPWPALGVLLMRDGLVEKGELEDILNEQLDRRQQRLSGRRLGEILVQRGRVTPEQVARLVAEQYELPFVDFDVSDIDFEAARVLDEHDARRFSAVAISRSANGAYLLAIAEPSAVLFSDELRRLLGTAPRFAVVGPAALETAIEAVYSDSAGQPPAPAQQVDPGIDDDPGREAILLRFPASSGAAFELLESRITDATETPASPLLGTLLVREGFVTESELDAALAQQRLSPSLRLGEILVEKGIVTPAVVARLVAEQYELPFVKLETLDVDHHVATRLPKEVAHRLAAVPVAELEDGSLEVAVADPATAVRSDELRQALDVPLSFVVGSPDAIEALLDRVHTPLSEVAPEPFEHVAASESAPSSIEPNLGDEPGEPEPVNEMPSVAFVLDAFAPPWSDEPPFFETTVEAVQSEVVAEAEVERVEPEVEEAEVLAEVGVEEADVLTEVAVEVEEVEVVAEAEVERVEPEVEEVEVVAEVAVEEADYQETEQEPPLLFHVVASAPPEEQALDDESDWMSRLALVDEVAGPEENDEAEAEVVELVWHSRPALEAVPDEIQVAEVLELARTAPVEQENAADVLDPPDADSGPVATTEVARVDTFEIGSQHATETDEEHVEDAEDVDIFEGIDPPDDPEPVATNEAARLDIFGIGSHPATQKIETDEGPVEDVETAEDTDTFEAVDPPLALVATFDPPLWGVDDVIPEDLDEPGVTDETVEVAATAGELETLVAEALAAGAASIHFSPLDDGIAVRARVDGFARDLGTTTRAESDALVAQLEADGVARTHVVTTSRGPRTTLFARDRVGAPTTLDELGLDDDQTAAVRSALALPAGAVLVCGPMGSGVTTTLHAMLEDLASGDRIVATIEDPVERRFDGVDQIEVNPSNGVTFASALRELRRADTDVTLVGDLADRSAAELALKSAYDGGLVVAGLRAPDWVAALGRLTDLGVERAVLAGSVTCVVSQRLLRTVCANCHETYYATPDDLTSLDQEPGDSPRLLVRGGGCASCGGTGFRGRVGVFEVLEITEEICELIAEGASAKKLRKAARAAGMRTLRDEGVRLCLDGVTTVAEVERVLGAGV